MLKFPIIKWIYSYEIRKSLLGDVSAGITIFAFLIPQSMALATFIGLPPIYGLYTSIFPLYVYAIFGTTSQLSMGPMAIISLILSINVSQFHYENRSDELIILILNITFFVGLFSIVLGICQLGWISRLISPSVLSGFVSASGLSIGINQFKDILGIKVPTYTYLYQTIFYLLQNISKSNKYSIIIGLSTWFILALISRWKINYLKNKKESDLSNSSTFNYKDILFELSKLSSFLILVIGTMISKLFIDHNCELNIVGSLPSGFLIPKLVFIEFNVFLKVLPTIIIIIFVCFASNLSITMKYNRTIDANQELIAFGLSNICSMITNSFVATGGLGRSVINVDAGATTQLSGIISATLMVFSILWLSSLFYYIPMAVLAGIIESNVPTLIDFNAMVIAYHNRKPDFIIMISTFICTLAIGESEGLFIGVLISFLIVLKQIIFPNIVHLGKLPESEGGYFRDINRFKNAEQIPGITIIRMNATLFFGNCEHFKNIIMESITGTFHSNKEQRIMQVVIDASCWIDIDLAGISTLFDLKNELLKQNINLILCNLSEKLTNILKSRKLTETIIQVESLQNSLEFYPILSNNKFNTSSNVDQYDNDVINNIHTIEPSSFNISKENFLNNPIQYTNNEDKFDTPSTIIKNKDNIIGNNTKANNIFNYVNNVFRYNSRIDNKYHIVKYNENENTLENN